MEQKLASLLRIIAYAQVDIEIAKTFIKKTMNSDLDYAFKIVDSASRGVISNFEISNFLERHRIKHEQDEIKMIVQYYDLKREGKLDSETFQHALTPRNKNIDKVIAYRKQQPARTLEDNIVNFFVKELELIRQAHDLRIQLHGAVGVHSFSFNRALDIDDKAAINYYDIDKFLQRQGIILSDVEISCILERGDRYYHNVITYPEFEKYIVPDVVNKKVLAAQIDSQHLYNALLPKYTTKQIPNPTDSLLEKKDKNEQANANGKVSDEKDEGIAVEIEPLYPVVHRAVPLTESNYRYTSYFNDLDKYYRPSRNHYTSMMNDYEREKKYITGEQILTNSNLGSALLEKKVFDPYQYYDKTYPFVSRQESAYSQPHHHQKYPYIAPYDLKNTSRTNTSVKSAATDYPLHMYSHVPTLPREKHETYSVTETEDIPPVPLPSTCYKVYERFPNYRYLSEAGEAENIYNGGVSSPSKGIGTMSSTYQPGLGTLSMVGDKFNRNPSYKDDKTATMLERLSVYDKYNHNVSVKGTELYGREDLKKKVESMIMKNRFI